MLCVNKLDVLTVVIFSVNVNFYWRVIARLTNAESKTEDYEELSEKITFFIKNKKKCKKMTNFSFNKLSRFDYEKNLNKYFDTVKKII